MEINATTTVIGRLRALRTKRICLYSLQSSARLSNEWLNVSGGCRNAEQPPPHAEPGQDIIDFSLREQSLRFGYFVYVSQSGLIPGRRLLNRSSCR
jgi:hypothetical protein